MRHVQVGQFGNVKKQKGATLLGMMIIGGAIVFVAMTAMKIFPAYQEYFSVKTALRAMKQDPLSTMSKRDIENAFDKRADVGYISAVKGSDLTIDRNDSGETIVSVEYKVIKPLFGNLSALMLFSTSSDSK